ncbi:ABC transporter permease [Sansalvadorimonas verongulae]|uniref:ABC transporter permease n=1 Tax=Sansalvadorimonas verongulae TaxID=2172824 RepID=UPI0012BC5C07|nr:ABC transporter permease [Sansalvadorimonas verongulae]MTI12238.1 ABC transporter permease [Sansalvadorimonas verongulae]
MDIDLITNVLFAMIRSGTPLLLVALGEVVCEKSGVLNLGQEGMMLMGAVTGFIVSVSTGNLLLGVIAGMMAGVAMSLLFGSLALGLRTNQVATGLALTIFGTGLSAFVGTDYVGKPLAGIAPLAIPLLSDIPLLGTVLFRHDPLVYTALILLTLTWAFFRFSRPGLMVKAVGENPDSATSIGLPVLTVRWLAVSFGGAMAGLGGAYLSLAYTPLWSEGMTAGRGWIALALVVFASWRIGRVLLGAWLFGLASIMHLVLQGMGASISSNLLATLPYLATIVVLVILSSNQSKIRMMAPMSLGKPFHSRM